MSLTTLDYIVILICIISGLIGYKRGAIRTLISFGGFIASFAIAWIFSPALADMLLNLGVFNGLMEAININGVAQALFDSGIQQAVMANSTMGQAILVGGQTIVIENVDLLTQALIYGIARSISFLLLLLASGIVIGILQMMFSGVSNIPIIGGLNRLLGLALGLVLGICLCGIVVWVLTAINTFTGGTTNLPTFEGSALIELVRPWVTNLTVLK